jgi:cell division septation protein DedD
MGNLGWRIVASTAVCALAAPASGQSVKAGIDAWQKGDYASAISAWRPLAEAGDADAAFNLGQAYRLGRGVQIDLATAQNWLETAARKGHVDAQTTLGLLLFQNGNRVSGLRWLRQAAEAGEPRAMLMYGTALFNGDGIAQDPVLAYAFVSRAAAQGLGPAKSTLEQMDQVLTVDQRKKGVAIAMQKVRSTAKPSKEIVRTPTAKPAAKPKPIPVRVAETPEKPPVVSTGGGWRIQLGAFGQRGSAEALFRKLAASAPVAGRQMVLVPAGSVTRLQVGPFDKASATAACRSLSARGQACFVVPGK